MRILLVGDGAHELGEIPQSLPDKGFVWIASSRRQFEVRIAEVQAALQRLAGGQLVDVHISDLLNNQLPSHYDYTSWYDMMVFRRLAAGAGSGGLFLDDQHGTLSSASRALESIDTSPVGFAVFDRVLVTVHPTDCIVRDYFFGRLEQMAHQPQPDGQRQASRLPTSPA